MRKVWDVALSLIFAAVIIGGIGALLLVKDRDFSENENRYLTQRPVFTMEGVISGRFMKDVEAYVNDQFVLRDELIGVKTGLQLLMGRKEINSVYIGKDGYLIEKWAEQDFNSDRLTENVSDINQFARRHVDKDMFVLTAPTSGLVMKDKLPEYAAEFDQKTALAMVRQQLDNNVEFVDITDSLLLHSDEYIYYKTDHHWTTLGAYYAYQFWCEKQNIQVDIKDYSVSTVSDSFRGTLYSKVLNSDAAYDSIFLFEDIRNVGYEAAFNYGRTTRNSVYNYERLKEKDQYQFFLGGNDPEVTIRTENGNGKHLLVIKDSYANAFIPFLINNYESIHVIDLRYYNQNIDTYMDDCGITDILVLYNIKSFSEDKNLYRLNLAEEGA